MPGADVYDDDYYAVLSVPRSVTLNGLQAAYARLSDDLAARLDADASARDALIRLNRAYAVLSKGDLRRRYDAQFFAEEIQEEEEEVQQGERRRSFAANALFLGLVAVVAAQVAFVGYLGREGLGDFVAQALGPLMPGGAG